MLPVGKLPPELLARFLHSLESTDTSLIIGPRVGEDAAVIDIGNQYLVAKTDPITFATDAIGWYAVCVNSNDIAAMGALPRWFLATILLPEDASVQLTETIFEQLTGACEQLNITLCGGHTEVTHGLSRPMIAGFMLGLVEKDELITSAGAQAGDDLLLTKGMAIEATSIIARERAVEVEQKYGHAWLSRAQGFLYDPGISVLRDAQIACSVGGVHAMHDPTEGGLATAVHELVQCSEKGVCLWEDELPIACESRQLCDDYDINPLGAISSGALLLAVDPTFSSRIIHALEDVQIPCARVGKVLPEKEGVCILKAGVSRALPLFVADEITKIFGS